MNNNDKTFLKDKFFIIKSFNKLNLLKSIETGYWATTKKNFEKLYYCLNHDEKIKGVQLFFSINESRGFQGIARVINISKDPIDGIFVDTAGRTCKWENVIQVAWVSKLFLNFEKCKGIRNPLNENKQIKISRDGQEIEFRAGKKIQELIIAEGEDWINNENIFSELQHKKRPMSQTHNQSHNHNKMLNMNMNQILGFANANQGITDQKSNIN